MKNRRKDYVSKNTVCLSGCEAIVMPRLSRVTLHAMAKMFSV